MSVLVLIVIGVMVVVAVVAFLVIMTRGSDKDR